MMRTHRNAYLKLSPSVRSRYLRETFSGTFIVSIAEMLSLESTTHISTITLIATSTEPTRLRLVDRDGYSTPWVRFSNETQSWDLTKTRLSTLAHDVLLHIDGDILILNITVKIDYTKKPLAKVISVPLNYLLKSVGAISIDLNMIKFARDVGVQIEAIELLTSRNSQIQHLAIDFGHHQRELFSNLIFDDSLLLSLTPRQSVSSTDEIKIKLMGVARLRGLRLILSSPNLKPKPRPQRSTSKVESAAMKLFNTTESLFLNPFQNGLPTIFCHIPKTGGTSLGAVLGYWFGRNFKVHIPQAIDNSKFAKQKLGPNAMVMGHFSRFDRHEIQRLHKPRSQRFTIVRDPFDIAVSQYFATKIENRRSSTQKRVALAPSLREHLIGYLDNPQDMIFNFLPKREPHQNLTTYLSANFLYVGLTEYLQETIFNLAILFGRESVLVAHLNTSNYDESIPSLRKEFRKTYNAEYELYNHTLELHKKTIRQ